VEDRRAQKKEGEALKATARHHKVGEKRGKRARERTPREATYQGGKSTPTTFKNTEVNKRPGIFNAKSKIRGLRFPGPEPLGRLGGR